MNLIIVGCGRIGSELAIATAEEGHQVTVVDRSSEAFERLGESFSGRTICGNILNQAVFQRADIENADGLAAVTPDDATNFVVARAAQEIFKVPNVVVRAYDPRRREAFEHLGIRSIATSLWGARRLTQLLTHPGRLPVLTFGHGGISLVEVFIDPSYVGEPLAKLQESGKRYVAAVVRGGNALLPEADLILQENDRVIISVPSDQISSLDEFAINVEEA
ncbi:MAG TPA: potassium transporter TrkA [Chloroflexi bacterium]|nr:potassium transporter TrkA [Chloroflexota bacterium]